MTIKSPLSLAGAGIWMAAGVLSAAEPSSRGADTNAVLHSVRREAGTASAAETENGALRLDTLVVEDRAETGKGAVIGGRSLLTRNVSDAAEILSDELVEVQMIRKSGYGNEVSMRGFGQSDLRVFVDGGILEGACGSRKDPSLSHINMLTVDGFEIREGPFDVTRPGCLGGYVNVLTRKPRTGYGGELQAKAGSHGFLSIGGTGYAGDDTAQALAGYNWSESDPYKDGNGDALWTAREGLSAPYNAVGRDAKAFEKQDVWGKVQLTPNGKHSLLLEHTYGRATSIMTPRVDFDTEKEITHLSKAGWEMRDLGAWSDELTLSFYRNAVEHYPTQKYRDAGADPKHNEAESIITGGSVRNVQETGAATFTYGADLYHRDWRGDVYHKNGTLANGSLIPDVQTWDEGFYLQAERDRGDWSFDGGVRVDSFYQRAEEEPIFSKSVTGRNGQTDCLPGGYLSAKYFLADDAFFFGGVGRSYRTPTSVERYIQGSPAFFGNPELDPTANNEADLGFECRHERVTFQTKAFYSDLEDFIYQEYADGSYKTYDNIDAHIYGGDVKLGVDLVHGFSLDGGVAYQRGEKDSQPDRNNDKDLGQIAPLKAKAALNYNTDNPFGVKDTGLFGTVEWVHSAAASAVDKDVGELKMKGWDILNLRAGYRFKRCTLNVGIDNVCDRAYAVANSYEWDVLGGTGANAAIVNEPGRFYHASFGVTF